MLNFFAAIQLKDVIAILALFFVAAAKYFGVADGFNEAVTMMLGYYFGHRKSGVDSGK